MKRDARGWGFELEPMDDDAPNSLSGHRHVIVRGEKVFICLIEFRYNVKT